MKRKEKKETISFTVNKDLKKQLNEISEQSGLKLSQIMRNAVDNYIKGGTNSPAEVTHLSELIALILERDDLPDDYRTKALRHYDELVELKSK